MRHKRKWEELAGVNKAVVVAFGTLLLEYTAHFDVTSAYFKRLAAQALRDTEQDDEECLWHEASTKIYKIPQIDRSMEQTYRSLTIVILYRYFINGHLSTQASWR